MIPGSVLTILYVNNGVKFCTKCGTPTGAMQNQPAPQRPAQPRPMNPQGRPVQQRPRPTYAPVNKGGYLGQFKFKLGPAMIGYFVVIVLLVLSMILISNSDILEGKLFGETVTADFAEIMKEEDGLEAIPTVTTIIHIVALVILLLPFIPKIRLSAPVMIPARLSFLWNIFWILLTVITYTENGRAKATFGAIMIIILSLGSFVYTFILARQNKKYIKAKRQRVQRPQMNL